MAFFDRFILGAAILCSAGTRAVAAANPPAACGASVPFTTCEAETPANRTTGKVITMTALPTTTTATPELEASGRGYVQLTGVGEHLEFPKVRAANTIVIRHCIPDAPAGGGINATLSLYVNGTFRQSLELTSKFNWLYGKAGENGQSDDPSAGQSHVFWDESRFFIQGGVRQGDTIRLQKDARDTAEYYRVDLIDLETAPAPLAPPPAGTYLSATDFGADGADTQDDTAAIQKCIDAAKAAGKIAWLPAGTYYQSARFSVDGVDVRGAGMWHTRLIGTVEGTSWSGNLGFALSGQGPKVRDLSIESTAPTRRAKGSKPFSGRPTDWLVENVWIMRSHVGLWMSGAMRGKVRGCRIRTTYADGINLNSGASDNVVEHNHLRGTGDDGLAVLSEAEHKKPLSRNNVFRFNTVIATWWGHNCDIAGGEGHVIEDNYFADNARLGCFTINLPSAYPMQPLTGAVIRRNTIVRGGGVLGGQKRGAVWMYPGSTSIRNVVFEDNQILEPIFRGIHLVGSHSQAIVFNRNTIDRPGADGIVIESKVNGSGVFKGNVVKNLKPGFQPLINAAAAGYTLTQSGNSWQAK